MNLGYEPQGLKIYLFGESVDIRKQMNGLIALVEGTYHMDPFEKALFLFTNKKKDKIKALKWDENGFVVYYKRLERGAGHMHGASFVMHQKRSKKETVRFPQPISIKRSPIQTGSLPWNGTATWLKRHLRNGCGYEKK